MGREREREREAMRTKVDVGGSDRYVGDEEEYSVGLLRCQKCHQFNE